MASKNIDELPDFMTDMLGVQIQFDTYCRRCMVEESISSCTLCGRVFCADCERDGSCHVCGIPDRYQLVPLPDKVGEIWKGPVKLKVYRIGINGGTNGNREIYKVKGCCGIQNAEGYITVTPTDTMSLNDLLLLKVSYLCDDLFDI